MTLRHVQARSLHDEVGASARLSGYDDQEMAGSTRPGHKTWHVAVGNFVHACCAAHADLRNLPSHEVALSVIEWVNAHARHAQVFGNLPKARATIASNANAYLTQYAPGPDANFLGAEIEVEGGRIDLAWFVPDLGIVVDEIKTVRQVHLRTDNPGIAQCHRYVDAGLAQWGDQFAGVRYLPLSHPADALFITRDHEEVALAKYKPAAVIRRAVA